MPFETGIPTPQNILTENSAVETLHYRELWLTTDLDDPNRHSAFKAFFGRVMQLEKLGKMEEFWERMGKPRRAKKIRATADRSAIMKATWAKRKAEQK